MLCCDTLGYLLFCIYFMLCYTIQLQLLLQYVKLSWVRSGHGVMLLY